MPPDPHCRPASMHADLGSAFYDPVDAARFPSISLAIATGAGPPASGWTA